MKLELVDPPPASEGWKTLQYAIPDGTAKALALRLHVSADYVRRWRREPFSDEAPLTNGQRSPLDRFCDLLDAAFLSHPTGAALILEHVQRHYQQLLEASLQPVAFNRRAQAAVALREAVDAVECLNLDAPDEQTIREIVEAQQAFEIILRRIRDRRSTLAAGLERLEEQGDRAS